MSNAHLASNRMSTPEASQASSLRPPSSRAVGGNPHLRASADMAALTGSSSSSRTRPSSDFYGQPQQGGGGGEIDPQDKLAQQWIADIDQYEPTLDDMATATLDQDFKDELSAIEQWFRVLSEAERTAALYALLQQTTQVQIRFFIQVLQQMGKNHPMSGVLSPSNFDKGKHTLLTSTLDPVLLGDTNLLTCRVRRSYVEPPQRCHEQVERGLGPKLASP